MAVVDLPGDSVVRILHLLCRWPKFNSWWGNSGQKSGGRVGGAGCSSPTVISFSLFILFRCESWTTKKAEHQRIDGTEEEHQRIVALKKNLESPLDNKGIKPVNPKGNQP